MQRVKDKIGSDIFKGLGMVALDLESLVNHTNQQVTFPLSRSSLGGARIVVIISAVIGEFNVNSAEESMSRKTNSPYIDQNSNLSETDIYPTVDVSSPQEEVRK